MLNADRKLSDKRRVALNELLLPLVTTRVLLRRCTSAELVRSLEALPQAASENPFTLLCRSTPIRYMAEHALPGLTARQPCKLVRNVLAVSCAKYKARWLAAVACSTGEAPVRPVFVPVSRSLALCPMTGKPEDVNGSYPSSAAEPRRHSSTRSD